MAKIRNFDSFGAVFPHFCPDKREIWHGRAGSPVPNFHIYWSNLSRLRGEKPIFGLLSKNNTGMASAGLPVIRILLYILILITSINQTINQSMDY